METVRVTTSQNIDIDYEVAGLGERIVARLIDLGLFILVFILGLIVTLGLGRVFSETAMIGLIIMYAVLYVFYDLLCEIFMNGQSIGKRIMKIKVISLDGGQPTFGQYLMRWVMRIIDFTLSGNLGALICCAVSEKRQRIGDIAAGTTLIRTNQRIKAEHVPFAPVINDYKPVFAEATQLSSKDMALIQDVIQTYFRTRNDSIIVAMAQRVRGLLSIEQPMEMNDLVFLQTIVKDHSYVSVQEENA